MHNRHQDKELYFQEQVYTTEKHVIPFIRKHTIIDANTTVLEVGCGEGGNLKPFLDIGCRVTGVDLSESKIDYARKFLANHENALKLTLLADDIYHLEGMFAGTFDVIILRDVIEHIHDQARFMSFIRNFLTPDGVIYFGFPPWYNPFGGHQQICEDRILSKLPYFHLLPVNLYKAVLKMGGESNAKIEALLEIKETGISIERFERIVRKTGYVIKESTQYFINPNYEVKFKLKPRSLPGMLAVIPFFRNLVSTSCYYLLKKLN